MSRNGLGYLYLTWQVATNPLANPKHKCYGILSKRLYKIGWHTGECGYTWLVI